MLTQQPVGVWPIQVIAQARGSQLEHVPSPGAAKLGQGRGRGRRRGGVKGPGRAGANAPAAMAPEPRTPCTTPTVAWPLDCALQFIAPRQATCTLTDMAGRKSGCCPATPPSAAAAAGAAAAGAAAAGAAAAPPGRSHCVWPVRGKAGSRRPHRQLCQAAVAGPVAGRQAAPGGSRMHLAARCLTTSSASARGRHAHQPTCGCVVIICGTRGRVLALAPAGWQLQQAAHVRPGAQGFVSSCAQPCCS